MNKNNRKNKRNQIINSISNKYNNLYISIKNAFSNKEYSLSYDVHNDAYTYDEYYSEGSSEFLLAPLLESYQNINYAKRAILWEIYKKNNVNCYDDYNDCSYPQVYDQN